MKKSKARISTSLELAGTEIRFEDIRVVEVEPVEGIAKFLYLEPIGASWRLLKTKGFLFDIDGLHKSGFTFFRNDDPDQPNSVATQFGERLPVTIYNTICRPESTNLGYYIEDLADGSLRISHGATFLGVYQHIDITGFEIRRVVL